jgi:hypothetical protein
MKPQPLQPNYQRLLLRAAIAVALAINVLIFVKLFGYSTCGMNKVMNTPYRKEKPAPVKTEQEKTAGYVKLFLGAAYSVYRNFSN